MSRKVLLGLAGVAGVVASTALAATFPASAPITIGDAGAKPTKASPYPSSISVGGLGGTITDVNVTLNGFRHEGPDDVDVLVASPTGTPVLLMSDAGDDYPLVTGIDLVFDDGASQQLPDKTQLSAGTYRPTNYGSSGADESFCASEPDPEAFPAPAPSAPYSGALSTFVGQSPNGIWNLYVTDDCIGSHGTIASGWTLDVATNVPTAVGVSRFTSRPARGGVRVTWRTSSEARIAGFNVYRARSKLNKRLIAARHAGLARGDAYALLDRTARRGGTYTYRLQVVCLDGRKTWFGATSIRLAS